jgi:hypothetical protein
VLDFEAVHRGLLRDDCFEQHPKSRYVPLSISERIEQASHRMLRMNLENPIKRHAGCQNMKLVIKDKKGFRNRVHDSLRQRLGVLGILEVDHGEMVIQSGKRSPACMTLNDVIHHT